MNKYAGYKTWAFNILMALSLILKGTFPESESPDPGVLQVLVNLFFDSFEALLIVGNMFLRMFSSTPIFWKNA